MSSRLIVADAVRTSGGIAGAAVLVEHRRVAGIGRAADLRRPGIAEERYPGGVIVPGFRDAHFHPVPYTQVMTGPVLAGAGDLDGVVGSLREADRTLEPEVALIANRLDDESLAERRLPDRHDLDRAVAGRPVLVHRYCGHIAVANTAALEAAGISPATPDPPGGSFDRDASGLPNGILRETAVRLVAARLPARATAPEALLSSLTGLLSLGLTGLGAIISIGDGAWCSGSDELAAIERIGRDMPVRLAVLVATDDPHELEDAAKRLRAIGPMVDFLGWKGFADGSLGGHTAALRMPYADLPGTAGTRRLEAEQALNMAAVALELDGSVAVHAIGDQAVGEVLDLFERLREAGAPAERLRMEHASLMTDGDVERMRALGVTASVQPAFLASETGWLEKRLGSERLPLAYRFRSLAEAGVPLAGGSDCPVEPPPPLWGMEAARTRAGIVPEEGLDAGRALAMFTTGAARAIGEPDPMEDGSPADFVVLDRDPFDAPAHELRSIEVLATWVDGEPVIIDPERRFWPTVS